MHSNDLLLYERYEIPKCYGKALGGKQTIVIVCYNIYIKVIYFANALIIINNKYVYL